MLIHLNLGSNIEVRSDFLRRALEAIAALPQVTLVGSSRIYETPPVGLEEAGPLPFLNLCAAIRTSLSPEKVIERTAEIEGLLGRPASSKGRRISRVIDIDIVLAEDAILVRPDLKIPHPGLVSRSFFLWPLVEICPNARCPERGLPLTAFLRSQVTPPILRTIQGFSL